MKIITYLLFIVGSASLLASTKKTPIQKTNQPANYLYLEKYAGEQLRLEFEPKAKDCEGKLAVETFKHEAPVVGGKSETWHVYAFCRDTWDPKPFVLLERSKQMAHIHVTYDNKLGLKAIGRSHK